MFDDLEQKNNQPSQSGADQTDPKQNQSNEEKISSPSPEPKKPVEDIFSGTDKVEKPDIFKPKAPTPTVGVIKDEGEGDEAQDLPRQGGKMKKILFFAIMIIGLVLVIIVIFWVLNKIDGTVNKGIEKGQELLSEEESPDRVSDLDDSQPVGDISEKEDTSLESSFSPQEIIKPLDSDQDGLTDEEEERLGTDINNVDTDNDGLFDWEEVKVYKTDPLNPDTDGDGYLDGEEVKNGYNPKGEGKLYEIE